MSNVETGGKKLDTGKLRYDLIPAYPLEKLAEVYTIGCKKYADRNWEKGISWARCFGALMRHAWKFWAGGSIDPDGQHHLAAVAFYCFALMEYEQTHPELDDRPKKDTPILSGQQRNEVANMAFDTIISNADTRLPDRKYATSGPAPCSEDIAPKRPVVGEVVGDKVHTGRATCPCWICVSYTNAASKGPIEGGGFYVAPRCCK